MSSSLWSGLTSYASGAINKAKEQLTELAAHESDSQDEGSSGDVALEQRTKEYERIIADKTQEVEELQDLLRSHITEAAASQRQSVAKMEQLEAELGQAMNGLVTLNIVVGFSDNAELQAYTEELGQRLKQAGSQVLALEAQQRTMDEQLEEHRMKEEALTDELMTNAQELQRLQDQLIELQGTTAGMSAHNSTIEAELSRLKAKEKETEACLVERTADLKDCKEELRVVKGQLKTAELQMQEHSGLKEELSQAKKHLADKGTQCEQLAAKLAALDTRLRSEVQASLEYQRRFEALEAKNHTYSEQTKTATAEAEQLRRSNVELEQRLGSAMSEIKAHTEATATFNSRIDRFDRQLSATETQLETTTGILEDREAQLNSQKSLNKQYEQEIKALLSQVSTLSTLKSSFEQDAKVSRLEAEHQAERLRLAEAEVLKYKAASNKLQELTEDFRRQLDSKDTLLDRLSTTIDETEQKLAVAEGEKAEAVARTSAQEERLKELEAEALLANRIAEEKVRQCNGIKAEAEALLQQFQADVTVTEHYVDRRVINTFLVKFFSPESSLNVKQQMLETLANILDFTKEQRQEVGLIEPEGLLSDFRQFITRED
jgi:chromosome segregation ATPase